MKSCLKVAYLKIAVIINAVTSGKTMRLHRLAARTLASHAGNRGSNPLGSATLFTTPILFSDHKPSMKEKERGVDFAGYRITISSGYLLTTAGSVLSSCLILAAESNPWIGSGSPNNKSNRSLQ